MANKNDKSAFQLGTDALSKIAHPRKHAQTVNGNIASDRLFLDELRSITERAEALCGGESKEALSSLLDDIRFSDPISTPQAAADELEILAIVEDLLSDVENGSNPSLQSIEKAQKLLSSRNAICKQNK